MKVRDGREVEGLGSGWHASGCSAWVLDNLKKKGFLERVSVLAAILVPSVIAWLCVLEEMSCWWKDKETTHNAQYTGGTCIDQVNRNCEKAISESESEK